MTHILITRPLTASQQLATRLSGLGLSPIVMPFYTFADREPGFDPASYYSGKTRSLAVFTSPRAVEYGLPYIAAVPPASLEFAVVGAATRRALEKSGRRVDIQASSGYTSEDLLASPELIEQPGEALVFCAPGGREALALGLAELGWAVKNAMVYERVSLSPSNAQLDELDHSVDMISVWTSVAAGELASECLPAVTWEHILNSPMVVISKRIQTHFEQMGAKQTVLSEGPGNPDIYQTIVDLIAEQSDEELH